MGRYTASLHLQYIHQLHCTSVLAVARGMALVSLHVPLLVSPKPLSKLVQRDNHIIQPLDQPHFPLPLNHPRLQLLRNPHHRAH